MRQQFFEYNHGANGFLLDSITGWEMQPDGNVAVVGRESLYEEHVLTADEFSRFRRCIQPMSLSREEQ